MSFKNEYYEEIESAIITEYRLYDSQLSHIPRRLRIMWRTQIKRLFEEGYLIKEITGVLEEAAKKEKWPYGTALFKRIRDCIDVARREKQTVKITGMQRIDIDRYKDLLKR